MSLLQTLFRPDFEEKSFRAEVARAANILQIGEFQLLQLAYHEWFSWEMPEETIDRIFKTYMLKDLVPPWARHYARHILALEESGTLDWRDSVYHRFDRDFHTEVPQGRSRFIAAVAVVVLFVGGLLLVGHLVSGGGTSVLPPYFDDRDIPPVGTSLAPGRYR
ncbi:MAG TPA: hypothetical protein DDZ83_10505 [Nitrospinae bacterium]|nr:hypothetical protein [Nitrospinota bacterium]